MALPSWLTTEQLANANTIIAVAKSNFSDPAQQSRAALIGIITAITESNLINNPGGDRDSVGLFQQQASWGSTADRMNPAKSAQLFYDRLKTIPNWDTIDPGKAAQTVQVSAYPDRYDTHLNSGNAIVSALLATAPTASPGGTNLIGVPNSVFTPQFWARIGVGVLGVTILTLALIGLLKDSGAGTTVINTAKDAINA